MAMVGRSKGFQYMRRALLSSCHTGQSLVAEPCLEAQGNLGGTHCRFSPRESGGENVNDKQVLGTSPKHMATLAMEGSPSACSSSSETISVTFVDKHGDEKPIKVPLGMSMLEAAHQNDIELEGACEGSLACSTCHVIVMDEKYYNKLPEPTDEENDMLDLAFGLTETSRLGCQVLAKPELDGMRLAIPSATRNFAVDGYVPKPH